MKEINQKFKSVLCLVLVTIAFSCEWSPSDEVEFATFPKNGEIFIDGFSAGLEYLPFAGSKLDAFSVDNEEVYAGTASMRFDVPNGDNQEGNYAGAIFPDYGGRNLTDFDALTFWAKASKATTIDLLGFGLDFTDSKYLTTKNALRLSTAWRKYIIPIPDPSKLNRLQGLFAYSTGAKPEGPTGEGYTFWIDELKFENTGTIAHPRPAIQQGANVTIQSFNGASVALSGLTITYNLGTGIDETVNAAPSFFNFNTSVARVAVPNELGIVKVLDGGRTKITAELGGVQAAGSLTINSSGAIDPPPMPTKDPSNVISLFSDAYVDVPVDFFNGFYSGSTTQTEDIEIEGNKLKFYTDLNYVGIEFNNPPVNASTMEFLHLDIWTNENPVANFQIKIRDRGSNGVLNTNIFTGGPTEDDKEISYTVNAGSIPNKSWLSIDIPLTGNIANQKNNLAQIVFIGDIDFLLDNLYFYK